MTLNVALHDPTSVEVNKFKSAGREVASVKFCDSRKNHIYLYVPTHVADALKAAFDRATSEAMDAV